VLLLLHYIYLVSCVCELHEQVKDLLELMLETKVENKEKSGDEGISTELVISNASMFLIAGYETVTNLLSFTSYLLALHPDVQEKLHSEIDQHFANNEVSSNTLLLVLVCLEMYYVVWVVVSITHQNHIMQSILTFCLSLCPKQCSK